MEKKNGIRFALRLLALLFAVLLPFAGAAGLLFGLPPVYGETFLGELSPKFERMKDTEGPKIAVIGGSSVAFGIDSALLSEKMGMPVVNFGLYATLGTKLMLDLSRVNIGEGDIIILTPEMDAQTLSLYFNAEAAWQALESDWSMLRYVGEEDGGALAGGALGYLGAKLSYTFTGKRPSPTGVYRRDSFNEYGDIVYPREANVMTRGYDTNRPIALTPDLFDGDFLLYLNAYIAEAEKKGASVFFSFCPMNADAMAEGTTEESLAEFYRYVCRSVRCPVIGGLDHAIMDAGYFYDTNFHLNDAGVTVRTAHLIEDLYRQAGRTETPGITLPEPPEYGAQGSDDPVAGEDAFEKYYVYAQYGSIMAIVGVTDEGKAMTALELPRTANGHNVRIVEKDAFAGCSALTDLTVYDNITLMEDGCLAGCTSLQRFHIRRETADDFEVGTDLFAGASSGVQVLLYDDVSYSNFTAGYWWGVHSGKMKKAN